MLEFLSKSYPTSSVCGVQKARAPMSDLYRSDWCREENTLHWKAAIGVLP